MDLEEVESGGNIEENNEANKDRRKNNSTTMSTPSNRDNLINVSSYRRLKSYPLIFLPTWFLLLWGLYMMGLIVNGTKANVDTISPAAPILRFYTITPQCMDVRTQVWRLFTNQFVHSGLAHIIFNTLMLLTFGAICEAQNGALYAFLVFQAGVRG